MKGRHKHVQELIMPENIDLDTRALAHLTAEMHLRIRVFKYRMSSQFSM